MTAHVLPAPFLTAIGSGKGGTGKTFIAVSLAQALAREGERVLLCDANFTLANAAVHLGIGELGDLPAWLDGLCPLEDVVVPISGGAGTRDGFDLLAVPPACDALDDMDAIAAEHLAAQLRTARSYTRVLIDLGAGVDAATMRLAAAADETLAVLTPDPAALTSVFAFTKRLLYETGTRLPRVLVNMADAEARRSEDAFAALCSAFLNSVPDFLGAVPRDGHVLEAVQIQCPLPAHAPQSPAARALALLARRLHARLAPEAVYLRAASIR